MSSRTESILKFVHFEQFKLCELEKKCMEFRSEDSDETIRNDQKISDIRDFENVLKRIEKKVVNNLYYEEQGE